MENQLGTDILVSKVNAAIEKHGMIRAGDGIVVGVSGGPDSVALLHVLNQLKSQRKFRLVAAHLDHGLRAESSRDAEFTREMSEALGVEVHVQSADVKRMAVELGMSVEEAGRRARYDFFEAIRAAVNAETIATAHHLDDRLETFFLRVFRGSTLTGLGGIPPTRGRIIRPFIEARRSEILHFLDERHIPYRIDHSNLSADTDRNFIRNRLMPLISQRFPDFKGPLTRTMNSVREEEEFLEDFSSSLKPRISRHRGNQVTLDIPGLREVPRVLAGRVILESLYELSGPSVRWARIHLNKILDIAYGNNPSAQMDLPGGIVLVREYDRVRISLGQHEKPVPFRISVTGPGEVHVPSTGAILTFVIVEPGIDMPRASSSQQEAYFDADYARFPLTVRSPLPGDRLKPWGMRGTRKLKEIFIDLKVPRRLRMQSPLIEKDGEILWIPGIRRSRSAPVVPGTRRVLKVSVSEGPRR